MHNKLTLFCIFLIVLRGFILKLSLVVVLIFLRHQNPEFLPAFSVLLLITEDRTFCFKKKSGLEVQLMCNFADFAFVIG